jgi:hypothetical protein
MDCFKGVRLHLVRRHAANVTLAGLVACVLVLASTLTFAQNAQNSPAVEGRGFITAAPEKQTPKEPAAEPQKPGFFGTVGRWFDQTVDSFNSGFRGMSKRFQNIGQDASQVAKTTVDNAKDAADAVGRIPNSRVMIGHEKCRIAPNGAPDCIAAAYAICKAKGFSTGKSLDMTTAEVCPAEVYLAGRNSGPGCRTETFVSRALCQ